MYLPEVNDFRTFQHCPHRLHPTVPRHIPRIHHHRPRRLPVLPLR